MKTIVKTLLWGLFIFLQLELFDLATQNLTVDNDLNMLAGFFVFIGMMLIMWIMIKINKFINKYFNKLKQKQYEN